jgi:hypothetical protein
MPTAVRDCLVDAPIIEAGRLSEFRCQTPDKNSKVKTPNDLLKNPRFFQKKAEVL